MILPRTNLSANFTVREIFGDHSPSDFEIFLAAELCASLLEPIRRIVGLPLLVTDGHRSPARHAELLRQGKKPSKTSDHSFGQSWYPWGAGAADTLPIQYGQPRAYTEVEYHQILAALPPASYGQLIWYRHLGHIHASNPRELVWSPQLIASLLPRKRSTFIDETGRPPGPGPAALSSGPPEVST